MMKIKKSRGRVVNVLRRIYLTAKCTSNPTRKIKKPRRLGNKVGIGKKESFLALKLIYKLLLFLLLRGRVGAISIFNPIRHNNLTTLPCNKTLANKTMQLIHGGFHG